MSKPAATWRSALEGYKGTSFPPAAIPLAGVAAFAATFWGFNALLPASFGADASTPLERLVAVLHLLPFPTLVFWAEFVFGAMARATSPKAAFSPAGAAALSTAPFAVVQANRIHQNHIECALFYFPAVACIALYGGNADSDTYFNVRTAGLLMLVWPVGRFLYRLGYVASNPFNRIAGVVMTVLPAVVGLGFGVVKSLAWLQSM